MQMLNTLREHLGNGFHEVLNFVNGSFGPVAHVVVSLVAALIVLRCLVAVVDQIRNQRLENNIVLGIDILLACALFRHVSDTVVSGGATALDHLYLVAALAVLVYARGLAAKAK